MREARFERKTSETEVKVMVNLDGEGKSSVKTGLKFLDHMIKTLSTHSLIDISITAKGDLKHHLIEDIAIGLGEALRDALGSREGINRFGSSMVPMDCSLAIAAIDLVKRPYSVIDLKIKGKAVEDIKTEDIYHFLKSLSSSLEANLHLQVQYGLNDHHKIEAAFKALALSLRQAISIDPRRKGIPSAKGAI
ncbi:MAG: imidazoleglycerol-phosphate dehydratase HisB [archaeon]|nr:imidazoleglycerol-phosphate dehydratase HisB [archaeon]MCP8313652.1 imidazoleglycerol-phosphate dehydratase HisB [archaeon]MCP8317107.1 imidazoleglycerol-phosphate dehydratase HisB [archaeon]